VTIKREWNAAVDELVLAVAAALDAAVLREYVMPPVIRSRLLRAVDGVLRAVDRERRATSG